MALHGATVLVAERCTTFRTEEPRSVRAKSTKRGPGARSGLVREDIPAEPMTGPKRLTARHHWLSQAPRPCNLSKAAISRAAFRQLHRFYSREDGDFILDKMDRIG
jgi:hypothetical protein